MLSHHWHGTVRAASRKLFPKQFTVGTWGPRFYVKHVRPFSVAMPCPYLRALNSWHLSPSLGPDVHPFCVSVLHGLQLIDVFHSLGRDFSGFCALNSQFFTFVFRLGK